MFYISQGIKRREEKSVQLSGVKSLIFHYIIINEWIKNGEFDRTEKIITVGTRFQAMMVNILFRRNNKRIYYCTKFAGKYIHHDRVKWIVFDGRLKKVRNDSNILLVP